MEIRLATATDLDGCVDVLRVLPDYFTVSTHDEVRASMPLPTSLTIVAIAQGTVIGFLLAEQRYPDSAEITFAAVTPDHQGTGVGSAVLNEAISQLASRGVVLVEAKTLDASSGYEPYVVTRAFWKSRGFVQIDCIDPLPGWEPGNPSAIYVKALAPT